MSETATCPECGSTAYRQYEFHESMKEGSVRVVAGYTCSKCGHEFELTSEATEGLS